MKLKPTDVDHEEIRQNATVKVGTHDGLVLATSRGDKSHRLNWSFWLQTLVTGTNSCPCNESHEFNPV